MKITKAKLKQIIKEELEVEGPGLPSLPPPEFTDYELEDMDTSRQMIHLLREIISQLKMLNQHTTPAKTLGASGAEKALSGFTVAEEKK